MTALLRINRVAAAIVATVLCSVLIAVPSPAQAFSGAFFPTQSSGNRGVDVAALQYLLQQRGFAVPADGVFGTTTEAAVKAVQAAQGLGADGVAGPATWTALVVTLRQGATGPAVRALQRLLVEKSDAWIAVSGSRCWCCSSPRCSRCTSRAAGPATDSASTASSVPSELSSVRRRCRRHSRPSRLTGYRAEASAGSG